jgi:hypothetical protein
VTGTGIIPNSYQLSGIYPVVEDFTQRGMARFNTCYPSAGVSNDGSYFLEDNFAGKAHKVNIGVTKYASDTMAEISVSDCWKNPTGTQKTTVTANVSLTDTPDNAYGKGVTYPNYSPTGEGVFGDGMGGEPDSASNAIRYFSLTGEGEWNTSNDVANPIIALFHSAHKLTGARTDKNDWEAWRSGLISDVLNGTKVQRGGLFGEPGTGYTEGSDAFIPVNSTRFGQYVGTFGPWNHVDEQNGLFGWVAKGVGADDPIEVYREHANRLKQSGL